MLGSQDARDILGNDDINLDWSFRYSLMWDILNGLKYIHNSPIKYHGNLKSPNCVVDGRFILKLTDFGPRRWLTEKERLAKDLLWTAPEVLRKHNDNHSAAFQKADIYSLAILMHEIVMREGQFAQRAVELNPEELLERIVHHIGKLCRPYIEEIAGNGALKFLIEACWNENPEHRPLLKTVAEELKTICGNKYKADNVMDNLLARMEQYANNLESLVADRTTSYLQQKKKAEDLLYRLLPRSIAEQIQIKGYVDPTYYESVSICFTDIVGFTSLSAESTPLEIVDMLNDLYSSFDDIIDKHDAYKVETIGDAYMVVSGLPNKNDKHGVEIASLAISLLNAVQNFKIPHRPGRKLLLRAGIHTGPCVAGVVGLKMPRYCLFGDSVNTASRMESNSEALKIHISEATYALLKNDGNFYTEERGELIIKGKGMMKTYWLHWSVDDIGIDML